jgi:hypothetical protein
MDWTYYIGVAFAAVVGAYWAVRMRRLPIVGKIIFVILSLGFTLFGAMSAYLHTGPFALRQFLASMLCVLTIGAISWAVRP